MVKKMKDWDLYFLRIAREVGKNSKCLSRKIGTVLVKDKAIISTGYNGPARGVKHCNERTSEFYNSLDSKEWCDMGNNICPRRIFGYQSGQGLHLCQAGHAERNALIQAARNGISTSNTVLYCSCPLPCKECMIEIINAGVKEIICLTGKDYDQYSRLLATEANIILKEINESDLI